MGQAALTKLDAKGQYAKKGRSIGLENASDRGIFLEYPTPH